MNGSVVGQGILRRHISKDETTSDLATIVAQRLLAKANLDAEGN